eukprot:TRINITY_DN5407_c0_g1_i1.p1 TRINITY_DN5407_c0_g1~~TRINITY_DN5407_c0_g1_i1.p1  ORF type:complete len:744 (+),score=176.46 TRINITY_DN5407_c0_g1_i1:86-2317(+)
MDFHEMEDKDGVRMSLNVLPSKRAELARSVVPPAVMLSPLKTLNIPFVGYSPVTCPKCKFVLNPYCALDFGNKVWACNGCNQKNSLPPNLQGITPDTLPPELLPQHTSVEYLDGQRNSKPPIFVFVVDTVLSQTEFEAIKNTVSASLALIPQYSRVALVTYGTTVRVHEHLSKDISRSFVFRGKDHTHEEVKKLLGLEKPHQQPNGEMIPAAEGRFVINAVEAEDSFASVLDDLTTDMWSPKAGHRPNRVTGTAIDIAASLLEACYKGEAARIMVFSGGPCTSGPGQMVDSSLEFALRSHANLRANKNVDYVQPALKFYEALAKRTLANGHCIDLFACGYDQVGLYEMGVLANETAGHMIQADSFKSSMFTNSFKRIFKRDAHQFLEMAMNSTVEVLTGPYLRVQGMIGLGASTQVKAKNVSTNVIGIGNTNQWRVNHLDPKSSLAFYFDLSEDVKPPSGQFKQLAFIQFITSYMHSSGQWRHRVTTVARNFTSNETPGRDEIAEGFDQETAAVVMARIAVHKLMIEDLFDPQRWLDRTLVSLVRRFAQYEKDRSDTFQLSPNFSIYPQFMYHLRRSQFIQVFNASPDETAQFRHVLFHNPVGESLIMIQPTLFSYSFDEEAKPVVLDSTELKPKVVLVLDSFFHVVVHFGAQIAAWRDQKYHEQEEHGALRNLLEIPVQEAKECMIDRFPEPRFIECDENGSQARFLLAKVNPSKNSQYNELTEDVDLDNFVRHLINLAVSS